MGILDETADIERLHFFNGQRLFAPDLQGIEAFNREMRWLHNRSLHQPGIGNGYAVTGKKGDREVTIQPGYAIDAEGREIVLVTPLTMQVPPVSGEANGQSVFFDLTVSYPSDSDLEEAETREGVCLPRGVVRLRESPILCWVRLVRADNNPNNLIVQSKKLKADVESGEKIVLARAEVLNCRLNRDLSIAQRRNARPSAQPRIAAGKESVSWDLWKVAEGAAGAEFVLGFTATVTLSNARFLTPPTYTARVDGPRPQGFSTPPPGPEIGLQAAAINPSIVMLLDGPTYIANAQPDGFIFFVTAGIISPAGPNLLDGNDQLTADILAWAREHWQVVWMGIEG